MTYSSSHARLRPLVAVLALLAAAGCNTPIPITDGGTDAPFVLPDGTVPCHTDADCDDHVGCTRDSCLPGVMVCGHTVDHAMCDDGIFCNGAEVCDMVRDCIHTVAHETCDDGNVCTIDRCDEMSKMCQHSPRDLDMDGDPDWFCAGGTDCDDRDPTRSGHAPELCADMIDNDCDDMIDEADCGRPAHDTCDDPIEITTSGSMDLSVAGATADYTLSCYPLSQPDVVARLTLTEPHDVTIRGEGMGYTVTLGLRSDCLDTASQLDCNQGYPGILRRRAMPAGTYYLIVASGGDVTLDVELTDPTTPPTNESCSAPTVIPPTGGHYTGNFVDVADDVSLGCNFGSAGDLVYQIDLPTESDLSVTLTTPSGQYVYWSVRSTCTGTTDLRCEGGSPADGTLHALPAGTYYIVIEGPSYVEVDYALTVDVSASSPPITGDLCATAIPLTLGTPYTGIFSGAEDDYTTTCGYFYRDLVHTFTLTDVSDVGISVDGGTAYVDASLRTTCDMSGTQLRCLTGAPIASHLRAVPAGTYYLIVEGPRVGSYTVQIDATPPTTPTPATGNDSCGSAISIPATTGGFWTGTTIGMLNDYTSMTCGISATPSPDVAFRLDLTTASRVFATTEGSSFDTVLYRKQNSCSTTEVACDDFSGAGDTGQLSESLAPGTYFYIIDGFNGASGNYEFQVFITPTP